MREKATRELQDTMETMETMGELDALLTAAFVPNDAFLRSREVDLMQVVLPLPPMPQIAPLWGRVSYVEMSIKSERCCGLCGAPESKWDSACREYMMFNDSNPWPG